MTDTTPLLMVVGGYNSKDKLLNDVELISSKEQNFCSKFVRPIFGKVGYWMVFNVWLIHSNMNSFLNDSHSNLKMAQ